MLALYKYIAVAVLRIYTLRGEAAAKLYIK